jgi:protein tyrosine/serine phosphatase
MLSVPFDVTAHAVRQQGWAEPVRQSTNLFRITPTLFRSAQLGTADVQLLQALGIKTVVSLRAFHSDQTLLKDSGINVRRVRFYTWDIGDMEVIAALREIKAAEKDGPVLLHCWHGADRTGLIAAMYRMVFQNWTKERALDELTNGGFGYHSMWKNIPRYIQAVDVEGIRNAVTLTH